MFFSFSNILCLNHQQVLLILSRRHILNRTLPHLPYCYPASLYHYQHPSGSSQELPHGLPASTLPQQPFMLHTAGRVAYGKYVQIILLPCLLHTCRNFPVCFKLNSKSLVWPTRPCFLLLLHPPFCSPSYSNVPSNHISLSAVCPAYQCHSPFRAFTLFLMEKMFPSTQFFRQLSSCHSSLHSDVIVSGKLSLTILHTGVTLSWYLRKKFIQ